jgi:hypothetical protein
VNSYIDKRWIGRRGDSKTERRTNSKFKFYFGETWIGEEERGLNGLLPKNAQWGQTS